MYLYVLPRNYQVLFVGRKFLLLPSVCFSKLASFYDPVWNSYKYGPNVCNTHVSNNTFCMAEPYMGWSVGDSLRPDHWYFSHCASPPLFWFDIKREICDCRVPNIFSTNGSLFLLPIELAWKFASTGVEVSVWYENAVLGLIFFYHTYHVPCDYVVNTLIRLISIFFPIRANISTW